MHANLVDTITKLREMAVKIIEVSNITTLLKQHTPYVVGKRKKLKVSNILWP
jgi:hypothetical protein